MKDMITDKMIEDKLANALNEAAPDLLDDLLAEIDQINETEQREPRLREALAEQSDWQEERTWKAATAKKGGRGFGKIVASCAAALVLMVFGMSWFGSSGDAIAVVGLDVNPSIEISINNNDKVISAKALNGEGEEILDGIELKGSDVKVACNAVVGSMMAKGYLTDTSNSVLVSVRSKDAAKGVEIEEQLAGDLNSYFEKSQLNAAILGQYYEDDAELDDFAEMYGVSLGKAWLMRSIAANDPAKTPESLATLSTQELILLAQEKKVSGETSYGSADKSQYIGSDRAVEIALGQAGISRSDAAGLKCEFDAENGVIVYEVEFSAGGMEYEYDINATDGSIISQDIEAYDGAEVDDGDDADDIDDPDDNDDDPDDHDDDNDDHDDDDDNEKDDD